MGLKAVCYILAIATFFNTFFYTYYTNRVIQVNWLQQMSHMIFYIIVSVVIAICVYWSIDLIESNLYRIINGVILYLVCYLLVLRYFDKDNWIFMISLVTKNKK